MTTTAILEPQPGQVREAPAATEGDHGQEPAAEPFRCALGHEELLTLARKVRAAAEDGDGCRFQEVSERFHVELERHLHSEFHDLRALPDPERSELAAGQQELRALAEALAGANPACPGVSRARPARLMVGQLQYQRSQERRALATRLGQ